MKIKVGTRGSRLALAQSQAVIFAIQKRFPDLEMELIMIKTRGDLDQKTRLDQMNEKGIFVKEIEEALLDHRIDIAIHSLKDMPSVICEGLLFSTPPKREDPRDVFVVPRRNQEFISFKKGARIGTGSIRRSRQLKEAFPDCEILPIRGNIDTRIQKMLDEDFDGIVLAAAGIHRLNLWESDVYQVLPIEIDQAIPSPCQGILGIQIRKEDAKLLEILESIGDQDTKLQMLAERTFMATLEGGCHLPIGAYLEIHEEGVCMHGLFGDAEGGLLKKIQISGQRSDAQKLAIECALRLKAMVYEEKGW